MTPKQHSEPSEREFLEGLREEDRAFQNMDRELWRDVEGNPHKDAGDYYADSIHVTEQGGIGINVGGLVYVRTLREWHGLIEQLQSIEKELSVVRDNAIRWQNHASSSDREVAALRGQLVAVMAALDLPAMEPSLMWQDSAEAIMSRVEEVADEAERGFRERDGLKEQLEATEHEKERLRSLLADVWADYAHQLDEPLLSLIDDAVNVYRYQASSSPASSLPDDRAVRYFRKLHGLDPDTGEPSPASRLPQEADSGTGASEILESQP